MPRNVVDQVVGEPPGDAEQRVPPLGARGATAAWIRWPAQYCSWLDSSLAYRGSPVTWM